MSIMDFVAGAGAAAEKSLFQMQKDQADMDKAKLIDQMAGKREEAGDIRRAGFADTALNKTLTATRENLATTELGANTRSTAQITSAEKIHTESETGANTRTTAQIASAEKIHAEAIASSERIAKISNGIAAGQLKLQTERDKIDNDIKNITLSNAQQVETLRKEYVAPGTSPDRRNEIHDTIQLLTGKDNDNIVPLPEKDALGNTTYSKALNRKTGQIVSLTEAGVAGAAPPVGTVVGGKTFKGGDPNKKENWSDAAAVKPSGIMDKPAVVAPALDPDAHPFGIVNKAGRAIRGAAGAYVDALRAPS